MYHGKRYIPTTVAFVIALAVILCSGTGCRPWKQNGTKETIIIAHTTSANGILTDIAFVNGYYAEQGLDVKPQPHAFGKLALQSVLEGKADLATVADTPIMFAAMENKKVAILAVIQTSNKSEAIVALRGRGIEKPSDFKGKTIGIATGTASHFFAEAFLMVHDIDRRQVKMIDLKPDEMAPALRAGKVDAVSAWNPVVIALQKEFGDKARTFYGETFYTSNFCMVGGHDFVTEHPETIKKVLRALVKAEVFVKQHPEESRRIVAEFIKTDKVLIDEIWDLYTFNMNLDQGLLTNLEDQTRWAMKRQLTKCKDMPNYLDFIYTDGLQAVKPGAVRIIR
jgi:ABC-type nitrate/sulfonate/bicarbonate transport system substrate-binding protein